MMALKGWKIYRKTKFSMAWKNKDTKSTIEIFKFMKPNKGWGFHKLLNQDKENFNTKYQAIKYAKNYMRSH